MYLNLMKKFAFNVVLLIFSSLFSCEESERIPEPNEAVNVRIRFSEGKSYFDFSDLSNAEIEYSVFTENKNIESIEIGLIVILDENTISDRIIFEIFTLKDFMSGSLTKSINAKEIAISIGYTGIDDFVGRELFHFDVVVTLNDGRVFPNLNVNTSETEIVNTNVSPNIQQATTASFTQNFSTFLGCPTEIIGGTYIGNATSPIRPCSNEPYSSTMEKNKETVLKQIGMASWEISDVTRSYYLPFGFNEDQPIQMYDICNDLISYDAEGNQFDIIATGTHNPNTNQIDLQWIDTGNSFITCENTYLPKI